MCCASDSWLQLNCDAMAGSTRGLALSAGVVHTCHCCNPAAAAAAAAAAATAAASYDVNVL
jgi:hypothetical protein